MGESESSEFCSRLVLLAPWWKNSSPASSSLSCARKGDSNAHGSNGNVWRSVFAGCFQAAGAEELLSGSITTGRSERVMFLYSDPGWGFPPLSICIACVKALVEYIISITIANRKLSHRGGSPHISDLKLVRFVCISGTLRQQPGHTPTVQPVGPSACTLLLPAPQESRMCAVTWRGEGKGEKRPGLNNLEYL